MHLEYFDIANAWIYPRGVWVLCHVISRQKGKSRCILKNYSQILWLKTSFLNPSSQSGYWADEKANIAFAMWATVSSQIPFGKAHWRCELWIRPHIWCDCRGSLLFSLLWEWWQSESYVIICVCHEQSASLDFNGQASHHTTAKRHHMVADASHRTDWPLI